MAGNFVVSAPFGAAKLLPVSEAQRATLVQGLRCDGMSNTTNSCAENEVLSTVDHKMLTGNLVSSADDMAYAAELVRCSPSSTVERWSSAIAIRIIADGGGDAALHIS
eukprot:SAG31_NODE_125_length_23649_cov_7.156202_22_plen_108_part_00